MKKTITKFKELWLIMLTILLFQSNDGFAQTLYPSSAGGNWASGGAWSTTCGGSSGITYPSNTSFNVIMSCAKTITATGSVNPMACNNLTISHSSAVLNVSSTLNVTNLTMSAGTLNITGTLNVSGTVSITGGSITGTGTLVLNGGSQNITSSVAIPKLNVTGTGTKTMGGNLNVSNNLILTAATLTVGANTLTVCTSTTGSGITATNGKLNLSSSSSLSFGGSWTQNNLSALISNTFPLTINNFTLTSNLCNVGPGAGKNLTVAGAFTLTAGKFSIGSSTLTLNGAITGNLNGSIIGGSSSDLTIGGSGASSMYFSLTNTNSGGTNTIRNLTINRTSHPFIMLSSLRIGGTLSQAANAKLQISNGSFQTLSIDGTVSGTAKLIGNSSAVLHINGSGSMGGTLTFDSTPQLSNLTMNRIGGTATIGSAFSVGNMLFKFGVLTNSALTTVTGGAPNNVSQEISSSYLNGAMARTIAANTNGASFIWPIGKSASQKLTFDGLTTGSSGNVVIVAEAFDGDSEGTPDATLSALKSDNYWSASTLSNPANLIAVGSVSLSDGGLTAGDAIGYSTTLSGTYTSLGGNIAGGSITSTENSPAALGFYNLGTAGNQCVAPTSPVLSATSTVNCGTASTTISITSGSLNDATNWQWYAGACNGQPVGTGTSITVSPSETTTYYVRGEGGCVTPGACSQITITVNTPQNWYLDADNDGYYVSGPVVQCSNPGIGYNTTATVLGDCDDNNNSVHATFAFYADADGDGYGAGNPVLHCAVDGNSPPAGYSVSNSDCNDDNASLNVMYAFYVDADGDGFGAGALTMQCAVDANTPPAGYSLNNSDCDDSKNTVFPGATEIGYNLTDDDCDGLIDEGFPPIVTNPGPAYCNIMLGSLDQMIYAHIVPGAQGYQWRVTTMSGPNTGQIQLLNTALRVMKISQLPNYAYDTTYKIEVAVYYTGYLQPYTTQNCTVTTPTIATQLTNCGQNVQNMNDLIYANLVPFASGYRFRVTDPLNPANSQTIDRNVREFKMSQITEFAVQYNKTYHVDVAVRNTDGTYLPFGSICSVTTPQFPTTGIHDAQCDDGLGGAYMPASMSTLIYAESYPGVTSYVFKLSGNGLPAGGVEVSKPLRVFSLNDFAGFGIVPGNTYNVNVRLVFDESMAPDFYGKTCLIKVPGGARSKPVDFTVAAYPNPFADTFSIELTTSYNDKVGIKVYDMAGRLLEERTATVSETENIALGNRYPAGVYNVIVTQGDEVKSLRVIKR